MPAAVLSIEKELLKGIVDLARRKEFYGHIVQQFERVFVDQGHSIETAAVGRIKGDRFIKLYLNKKFFGGLYEKSEKEGWKQILGVLEHDILHVVFGHLFLIFQDRIRGNVAKDLVVNSYIDHDTLPGNYVSAEKYGLETGKSALWYYTHLQDNKTFQKKCADGQFGIGGVHSHIMSSHGMWSDVEDDVVAKEFAKDIIRKSKELCEKSYGDIPGGVIEQIDALLKREKQIVPWNRILRTFVASCAESALDFTVKRISKRYGTRPGTRKADILNLAVAIDTSGSISDAQLKIFFSEIMWLWRNGVKITIYECDCRLGRIYPFKGKFDGKITGRGGTDLEPVLKDVEGKFDALIYFTDFEAPVIHKVYRIPILWVLDSEMCSERFPVKYGRRIVISDGKARAA